VLVHVIAETNRHAGHSDILRELIDGSVGRYTSDDFDYPFEGRRTVHAWSRRLKKLAIAGRNSGPIRISSGQRYAIHATCDARRRPQVR
jgi:hypothetical protein